MTQSEFELITLSKPPALRIEYTRIPTDQIVFDTNNPRLKYLKELFPDKTDAQLLFDNEDSRYLKRDIHDNGIIDAIYVRVRTEDASYVVIEGNRRTAATKELHAEHPDNPKFATMPARILPGETTVEQEALLMASFHVAGKVKWEAHEKAGHIYQMLNKLRIPESELSVILHMGVPAIKRAAESFELLEKFKKIDGGVYAAQAGGKWSFFAELLRIKMLRDERKKGPEFEEKFMRWVGDKRLPRAEDVRELPEILKKNKARKIFEEEPAEGAFDKAMREVDKGKPGRRSPFFKLLEKLVEHGRTATLTDITDARSSDDVKGVVVEAYQVLTSFMDEADVHRPGGTGTARRVA